MIEQKVNIYSQEKSYWLHFFKAVEHYPFQDGRVVIYST